MLNWDIDPHRPKYLTASQAARAVTTRGEYRAHRSGPSFLAKFLLVQDGRPTDWESLGRAATMQEAKALCEDHYKGSPIATKTPLHEMDFARIESIWVSTQMLWFVEFGYKACEKGWNLDKTTQRVKEVLCGTVAPQDAFNIAETGA